MTQYITTENNYVDFKFSEGTYTATLTTVNTMPQMITNTSIVISKTDNRSWTI